MPKQETKTIYCAKCNKILCKAGDEKTFAVFGYLLMRCRECGVINKITAIKEIIFEVSVLKNGTKNS